MTAASAGASAAEPQETRLALAIPITVPAQPTGLIPADVLETYTAPNGILSRELDAVIGRPVAIGLDPMIVASIRILGNTAPQSATDWLQRLQESSNETFSLSYADSDVSALRQAGSTGVLGPTYFPIDPALYPAEPADGGEEPSVSPSPSPPPADVEVPTTETITDLPYTLSGIVWPRQNTVTVADLASFNASAPVTTVVSAGNLVSPSTVSATIEDHRVLVADDTVSQLLSQAVRALSPLDWQQTITRIKSELNSRGGGTILATFDRSIPQTANRLAETVAAITQLTGITLTDIASAMAEPASAQKLVDSPVNADRISRLRLMLAAEALLAPFSSVLTDPAPLTGERRLSLLALSSNSWVDSATWMASVDEWLERSNAMVNSVQIAESSTLNFFQDRGNLPIAVSNNLDYPVTVYVTVRSGTGILVVTDSRVPIEIEAGSQARAAIPVQSIANGEATLQVSLSSATNVAIGAPKTVTTNVVAGWETTATWVIAALLLALFVAGIVRTILKRRRMREIERAQTVEHSE